MPRSEVKFEAGWIRKLLPGTQSYLDRVGGEIVADAQAIVPVDTGDLRRSIKHTVVEDTVVISAEEDYAMEVEFGTSKMAAQPYLRPALYKKRR